MLFLFTKREIVMLLQQIIIVVLLLSAVHDCSLWVELWSSIYFDFATGVWLQNYTVDSFDLFSLQCVVTMLDLLLF